MLKILHLLLISNLKWVLIALLFVNVSVHQGDVESECDISAYMFSSWEMNFSSGDSAGEEDKSLLHIKKSCREIVETKDMSKVVSENELVDTNVKADRFLASIDPHEDRGNGLKTKSDANEQLDSHEGKMVEDVANMNISYCVVLGETRNEDDKISKEQADVTTMEENFDSEKSKTVAEEVVKAHEIENFAKASYIRGKFILTSIQQLEEILTSATPDSFRAGSCSWSHSNTL